jgi:hypothetical protein
MLDTLQDGAVTMTVHVTPRSAHSSEVTVAADFKGTYRLGSSETTAQCVSTGQLENRVLEAAGAAPQAS